MKKLFLPLSSIAALILTAGRLTAGAADPVTPVTEAIQDTTAATNAVLPPIDVTASGTAGRPAQDAVAIPLPASPASARVLGPVSREQIVVDLQKRFEQARYLRTSRQPQDAEPILVSLLDDPSPVPLKQSALLELAAGAEDEDDLSRAQDIYAQFLSKWPDDRRVPEVLLRQGLLFRRMGLDNLAFIKFYAVMTSALVLKNDQFDYYVDLVRRAQIEIAESNYQLGRYADAADFFSRLLEQDNTAIDKAHVLYKLVRCEASLDKPDKVLEYAQLYLDHYSSSSELPEVRFDLAMAMKQLGRNTDSLQQVLTLLREQRDRTRQEPDVWAYWQQRCGNLIANQLYREGDYTKALEIYLNLDQLDSSVAWQLPVEYQIGMTYERLWQPQKATEIYNQILGRQKLVSTNASPGLQAVFEMAGWRLHFIEWQSKAEAVTRNLHEQPAVTNAPVTASLEAGPVNLQ